MTPAEMCLQELHREEEEDAGRQFAVLRGAPHVVGQGEAEAREETAHRLVEAHGCEGFGADG